MHAESDLEDVPGAESRVIDASPGSGELVLVRVLGVAAAGVDGDVLKMARPAHGPHQRPRVALVDDDVHVPGTTVAQVRLELSQRVALVFRRLQHVIIVNVI